MSQAKESTSILPRIERARAYRNPITRVSRLTRLALRAGPKHVETVITAALGESACIEDPQVRDIARDFVTDALIELGQHAQALVVASKMESAFQRALCYAEVRHASGIEGDMEVERSANAGFNHARDQLDGDSRAELERVLRVIEADA